MIGLRALAGLLAVALPLAAAPALAPELAAIGPMPTPRAAHTATRLADGRVLIAGGCQDAGCEEGLAQTSLLFDPARGRFERTGPLHEPRAGHRAVPLRDGSVLVIGGWTASGPSATVERYVPATGRFERHGALLQARDGFSATALRDGSILIAGGYADGMRRLASAERYDPRTGRATRVGDLATARMSHTATLLADGRVLVAGGSDTRRTVLASLELFEPARNAFRPAGALAQARHKHAAVRLDDAVLVLGGAGIPEAAGHFTGTERWDPATGRAGPGPRLGEGRYKFLDAVAVTADGRVLVAGGGRSAELLDAGQSAFRPLRAPIGARLAFATATPLRDGRVLVAGGYDPSIRPTAGAWIVRP